MKTSGKKKVLLAALRSVMLLTYLLVIFNWSALNVPAAAASLTRPILTNPPFAKQNLSQTNHWLNSGFLASPADCQALVVTSTGDDGNTCGSLRYALAYLTANPSLSPRTITFSFTSLPTRIALSGNKLVIPPNTTIQGSCTGSGDGPQIIVDGSGITDDGIILSGNDNLFGLKVGGFAGRTIINSATPNTLHCVSTQSGGAAALRSVGPTSLSTQVATSFSQPLNVKLTKWTGEPISGETVSFQSSPDPTTGATGTFSSTGTGSASVMTDSNGQAVAPTFTANTVVGSFLVQVTAPGVSTSQSVTFYLTSQAGPTANLTITAGNNQSATVGTNFPGSLKVVATDAYGNVTPNVGVSFTAPNSSSAPGGAFSNGTAASLTVNTDLNGEASVSGLKANGVAGNFILTASVVSGGGGSGSAAFSFSNLAGPAATITAIAGNGQSANVGAAYSTNLTAKVSDSFGNALSGVMVTFSAPASGASGNFTTSNSNSVSVTTDQNGLATAPTFTANSVAGTYRVLASVANLNNSSASFSLTNFYGQTSFSASVSDPQPSQNTNETVYAQLIVNGQPISGVTVNATWHYKTTTSYCSGVTGSDGTASCTKNVGRATLGYTVVIDVEADYNGQTYTNSTSFTP